MYHFFRLLLSDDHDTPSQLSFLLREVRVIVGPPRCLWGQLYGVYNTQEKCSVNVTPPSSPSPGGSSESQERPVALPEAQGPPLNDEGLEGTGGDRATATQRGQSPTTVTE